MDFVATLEAEIRDKELSKEHRVLAAVKRFAWEKRVRARCHSEIAARASRPMRTDKHMVRRLSLVDVAALVALCVYLSALLQDAARLRGLP
jgi:hypothetical protein